MKNVLIFIFYTVSIYSFGQIPLDPTTSPTTTKINTALTGHITCSTAANTYTGLLTGWTSYPSAFDVRFTNHNTGAATFELNSLGAKAIKKFSSGSLVDLASGDIPDAGIIRFQYDGSVLIAMSGLSVGSGSVTTTAPLTGTSTIGITQSTTSTDGYLSSTDWNTFNSGSSNLTTLGTITTGTWHGSGISYQYGGTGMSSVLTGDLIMGTSSSSWGPIHIGTNNQVLTSNGTTASWQTPSSGFADPLTTNGDIIARVSGSTTRLAQGSNGTFLGVSGGILGYYTPSGSAPALSAITAATGSNTINNVANAQEWQWNSLAGGSGFKLSSTSTAAASNTNKLFEIATSGANGTSTQTTYGQYLVNSKTGTSSSNVGIYAEASGGTNNYAVQANGEVTSLYTTSGRNIFNLNTSQGATYGHFNHTLTENNINADGQFDDVYRWGYNLGARRNSSEASLEWAMESHYQPFGNATDEKNFEMHLESTSYNGTHRRIFSANISKNVGTSATFQTNSAFWTLESMDWRDTPTGTSYYNVSSGGQSRLSGITPQITLNETTDAVSHVLNAQAGGLISLTNAYTAAAPSFIYSSNFNNFSTFTLLNNSSGTSAGTILTLAQASKTSSLQLTSATYGTIPNTLYFNHSVTSRGFAFSSGAWGGYDMAINQGSVSIGVETTTNAALYIAQRTLTSAWKPSFRIDPGPHTGMTASTAFIAGLDIHGATQTWGSGTIAIQAWNKLNANTLAGTSGTNTATISATLQVDPTTVGTNAAITNNFTIYHTGKEGFDATLTTTGTTGAQTINKPAGTVNIAAAGSSVVVTNSLCTANSLVIPFMMTSDATAKSCSVVPGAGSFTITLNAAATAEVKIGFLVTN